MDLSGWFDGWERMSPNKVAVHFEGHDITYSDMAVRIRRLSAMLESEYGIGRGDRVAHVGYNSPELFDLFFACARLGAICVTLNWRLTPVELKIMLGREGLVPPLTRARLAELAARFPDAEQRSEPANDGQ